MSINTVLTQILTSLECGLQRYFMRTGVRVSMFRNFVIHQIFSEFLQPLGDVRACTTWVGKQQVTPFPQQRVSPFFQFFFWWGFWDLVGLVHKGLLRSTVNRSWHVHWRDVILNSILLFSSLITTWCYRRWWWRAWRRCSTMTPLSWKCPWSWQIRTGGRTRWQAWNHDRNEVLRLTLCSNPVLDEMWFLTIDSFIRTSVFIAKLSKRQYCWRVFEAFSKSRIYPILWHTPLPLHAFALLHWRLWLS